MHIIHVRPIILLIPHRVFPIPPLPNPPLTPHHRTLRPPLHRRHPFRKQNLDRPPPPWEIRIFSGNTTQASIGNGRSARTRRTASRKTATSSVNNRLRRSARVTVKKYAAPATRLRR